MNNVTFNLIDKKKRIYRSELIDAGACAAGQYKLEANNSGCSKADKIMNDPVGKAAMAAVHNLWNFCAEQWASGSSVKVRAAVNNSTIEAELSSWWELKTWLCRYRLSAGGAWLLWDLHSYCKKNKIVLPYLGVYFGSLPEEIYNSDIYFKNQFNREWMRDELNRKMIQDVDQSTVADDFSIESPVLGNISPFMLSGGVKTLILMHECPDKVFNASNCGNNCARWIVKLAREQDFNMTLHHIMYFGKRRFQFYILNTGEIVNNMSEFLDAAAKFV